MNKSHEDDGYKEMILESATTEKKPLKPFLDPKLNRDQEKNAKKVTFSERLFTKKDEQEITMKPVQQAFFPLGLVRRAIFFFMRTLKFSILREESAKLLGDLTFFPKKINKYRFIKNESLREVLIKMVEFLSFALDKWFPVLDAFHYWRLFIDFLNFLSLIFLLFWIPMEIGLVEFLPAPLYIFFFLLFICDILLNMNTSFIENGNLIKDRRTIVSRYLKTYFLFDCLSCLCFAFDPFRTKSHYPNYLLPFQCLFFLRIRNLKFYYNKFLEIIYSRLNIRGSLIDLVNLTFITMIIIQILGCIWHALPYYDMLNNGGQSSQINWLTDQGISEEQWTIRYHYSVYWAAVTIMTVGYGDITPKNTNEMIFAIIAVCVGCGTGAFIINSVGSIFAEFMAEKQAFKYQNNFLASLKLLKYRQSLYVMNNYMNRKKISAGLQIKVRQYLRYIWKEELTQNAEMESGLIGKLSKSLKDELMMEAHGSILNKFQIFYANFSERFLRALMNQMHEVRYNPGEFIFSPSEPAGYSVYFCLKGEIVLSTTSFNGSLNETKKILRLIKAGDLFGEMSFITGESRIITAQSENFSSCLYINREDFIKTLKEFPNDYQRFCQMRENIMLNNDFKGLNMKCNVCKRYDHIYLKCPLLHYNKETYLNKIADMYRFKSEQKTRRFYQRCKFKTPNSLRYNEIIRKRLMLYQENSGVEPWEDWDKFGEKSACEVLAIENYENNEKKKGAYLGNENQGYKTFENPILPIKPEKLPDKMELSINHDILRVPFHNKTTLVNFGDPSEQILSSMTAISPSKKEPSHFEVFHVYYYYWPEHNDKRLIRKKKITIRENPKTNKKFQNFFLESSHSSLKKQREFLIKYRNFFGLDEELVLKRRKESYYLGERSINLEGFPKSIFDVVYEVLTNDDLREKLRSMKKDAANQKKFTKKHTLF